MIVYKATNIINGKVYVGKTINTLNQRRTEHKIHAKNNYSQSYFGRSIRKHGFDNFKFEVICTTDCENKLNALEKFYIACYKKMTKVYNLTDGGEGMSGYKHTKEHRIRLSKKTGKMHQNYGMKHSEEAKEKISKKLKGRIFSDETRKKNSEWHNGKKLSQETKDKISNSLKGGNNPMFGKKHSEETKKKISEAKKGMKYNKN